MNYRKSDIKTFFDENVRRKLMGSMLLLYCSGAVVVFLMLLCIGLVTDLNFSFKSPSAYIFIIVAAVVIFLAINRSLRSSSEKMYRDFMELYDKETITCQFGLDRVFIKSTGTSGNGSILYNDMEKVVESDNYFYLFVSDEYAQIIKKSTITQGTVETTRDLLKTGMKDKYKSITKLRG